MIARICPGYPQATPLQATIQVPLQARAQAAGMITILLALLTSTSQYGGGNSATSASSSFENGQVLNSMSRFWNAIASDGVQLDYSQISIPSLALFLDSLCSFYNNMCKTEEPSATLLTRFSMILSQATAAFLNGGQLPLAPSIEKSLCLNLLNFASIGQISWPLRQRFIEHVLHSMPGPEANRDRFDGLGQDLQV